MKGKPEVIEFLDGMLHEELLAISQYQIHAEIYNNLGYHNLHEHLEKASIDEMKHAEDLMARILFLEGHPVITDLDKPNVGMTVPEMLENDRALEQDAINRYNEAITAVSALGDHGTKILLDHILLDEEGHVNYFEEQLGQIDQLGLANYLMTEK